AIVNNGSSYSKTFGEHLSHLAQTDKSIVAITAAMPQGTGLDIFAQNFPNRFFDVGIAEQHAVTMAAGLARNGLKPVVAIYSSFLQRAYDQVLHDVALQNLHVVFAIDRAGIVGDDGETHQGIYDISFLSHIPNMTILAPCDYNDFKNMLSYAISEHNGPIAIRYPRGKGKESLVDLPPLQYGKSALILEGTDVTIAAAGKKVQTALQIADILKVKNISAEVIYARFIKPLDEDIIFSSASKTGVLITVEDNAVSGGFGVNVLQAANNIGINNIKIKMFGYPDQFISHGTAA
ncbi:MAG: transketolase C-terminal domain-containing protein, partial [Eubacteriaceae bacterium]